VTDEFERDYLGTEDVVHREKVAFRAAFVLVGGLSVAGGVLTTIAFAAAAAGDPQALVGGAFMLVMTGVLALASVVGSVLRTVVTRREIVLHAGIRNEVRIPLAGVTGVALTRYDAEARRRVLAEGKKAFAAVHPTKELVRIEWLDAEGRDHVAYAASDAPEVLADVIRRASAAAKAGPGPRVRVADEGSPEDQQPDETRADEEPRRAR
jgi:hypothetical protein